MSIFKKIQGQFVYKTGAKSTVLISKIGSACINKLGYNFVGSADPVDKYSAFYEKKKDKLSVHLHKGENLYSIRYLGKQAHKDALQLAKVLGGEFVTEYKY
jgi:hypothetical protein